MAVPKRRHSNSRSGKRRSHHHHKPKQLQVCPKCNSWGQSHTICAKCGSYMGRVLVQVAEKK